MILWTIIKYIFSNWYINIYNNIFINLYPKQIVKRKRKTFELFSTIKFVSKNIWIWTRILFENPHIINKNITDNKYGKNIHNSTNFKSFKTCSWFRSNSNIFFKENKNYFLKFREISRLHIDFQFWLFKEIFIFEILFAEFLSLRKKYMLASLLCL